VLPRQARLAAGGANVLDAQPLARYARQREARAQYLAAPLSHAAVD
jgi:hypothetical protein